MTAPTLKLNDGREIPQIGLGTWPMKDAEVADVIVKAIGVGYRHFDTALNYGNEKGVGEGVKRSGIAREEVFITTKVPGRHHGFDKTLASLDESLERLGTEYVDLYLIHWPNPSKDLYVDTWLAFVELQKSGKAKSIGVSNFKPAHIDRIVSETGVTPSVNQIQLYPAVTQDELRKYDEQHGIITESWSPLGKGANAHYYGGKQTFLDHPTITSIASRHGKTGGQIVLRWHIQQGLVALPKTSNAERLQQNIDVFDFTLSDGEMQQLSAIDDSTAEVADSDAHEEM